jgi:hypothetical protein
MTFRYVPFSRVEAFLQMGWCPGAIASYHSIIMWACICNPSGKQPKA